MQSVFKEKQFWNGLLFLAAGGAGLYLARDYELGTAARMGAGYFPMMVSGLLLIVGIAATVQAFLARSERIERLSLKGVGLIALSVVAFGGLVRGLGFPLSLFIASLIAASASRDFRFDPKALVGLAVFVIVCTIVFIQLLRLPLPVVGSWLSPFIAP